MNKREDSKTGKSETSDKISTVLPAGAAKPETAALGSNAKIHEPEKKLKLYRLAAERSRDIMLFFRTDGQLVEVNEAALNAYGYAREEILSKSFYDIRAPETWAEIPEQMRRAERGAFQFETIHCRKNGSHFPVEASWSFIELDGEQIILSIVRDITERRESEKQLRESEVRFRLASDAAAALVYDADLTGKRGVVAYGLERVTGYKTDESDLSSSWWHGLIHPEDLPAHLENYTRHLESGGTYKAIYRVRHKNGAWIWVEDTAQIFQDASGAAVQMVGTIIDISERKFTEEALRYQLQLTQSITDTAAVAIFVSDRKGRVTFLNPEAEKIFGYTLAEIKGKNLHDTIHYRRADGTPFPLEECPLGRVYEDGKAVRDYEDTFFRKDGSAVTIICSNMPIIENGELAGEVMAMLDISERKETEAKAREAEERFRLVTENLDNVFWIMNWREKLAEYVSPAFNRLYGDVYTDSLAVDFKNWTEVIYPDDRERAEKEFFAIEQTGKYESTYRIVLPDGTIRWRHSKGSPIRGENGEILRIVGVTEDITYRKFAEEAVRESEERYRLLVSVLTDVPWTTDADGAFVEMQTAWAEYTEQTWEEMRGFGWTNALHPDDRAEIRRVWEQAVAKKSLYESQGRFWHAPSQAFRYFIARGAPLLNDDGSVRLWVGTCTDVHERRLAEQQISGQNQTLEALAVGKPLERILDLTTCAIEKILPDSRASVLLAGADGRQLFCGSAKALPAEYNAAIEGVMIGEGVGSCGTAAFRRKPVIVSDISQDELWKGYRELAAAHDLAACWSHPILAPDGALLGTFATYFSKPRVPTLAELEMLESAARVAGIAIYRKQTEEALQKSEEEFRQLANTVPQIVWVSDAHGTVTYVNEQWTEFSGLSLTETGQPEITAEIIHPDDRETVFNEWARALKTGTNFEIEGRMRNHRTGEFRWFLMRSVPVKSARGRITQWFGTATDITANKMAERERERLLESERIARAEAEAANRAKDEFLAVLSHELRTPLNSIKGWVSILQNHNLGEEQRTQAIEVIARNVSSQNALIEDILDVSRIISGKMRIETERISFVSLLQNVLDAMRPIAEKKNINLQANVDASADEMDGDAFRLQQIISNLLNNAIKFTPEGGEIKVTLERQGDTALLTVADTGIGIAPELLPRIFDRFQQADGTSKRKFGGLGLGLAIVKHLAELHGGAVSAASDGDGKGAAFTVELPLVSQMIFPFTKSFPAKRNDPDESALLANLRLLVVDDDADALDLMRVILETVGASVVCVNSAQKALKKIAENKFDLLISDVGMAEMDGYDLIRAIRENLGLTAKILPAIALSGYVSTDDRARALNAGFQQHLGKPVDPIELPQKIKALVG